MKKVKIKVKGTYPRTTLDSKTYIPVIIMRMGDLKIGFCDIEYYGKSEEVFEEVRKQLLKRVFYLGFEDSLLKFPKEEDVRWMK